jgi:hypothetical protein
VSKAAADSGARRTLCAVIAGLDPAIHAEVPHVSLLFLRLIMDARVKPAHDAERVAAPTALHVAVKLL